MNKILSKATELVGFSGFQQLFGLIAQKQEISQTCFLDKIISKWGEKRL